MGGVASRGVEEHELGLINIGKEAEGVEPCKDFGDSMGEVSSGHSIHWA